MAMRAQIGEQCVITASAQFWEQMLAMKLEPQPMQDSLPLASGHVYGSVSLSGVWVGRVEVRLTGGLAREATAAMMMVPSEEVGEAETLDAAREIANIIGGVIKSCLPRPTAMALPEVAREPAEFTSEPAAGDDLRVVFQHPSGMLIVRVWEQECTA